MKPKVKKQDIPWKAWKQGQIMTIMIGMVLLNGESKAYTNQCGCPPSSVKCDRPPQLPSQCYCEEEAFLGGRTEKTCLAWRISALQPLRYPLTRQPLGKVVIKGKDADSSGQPTLLSQGYCPITNPLPPQKVHLGYIAGLATNSTVDHVYAHPQFGLVGVNATTHAKVRFGEEGHYQDNYEQYVPECHCFIRIEEVTTNGWVRVLDDWTLWMGVKTRGKLNIPPKYLWQYKKSNKKDVYGWPLLELKTPRPPEKLLFQRHLDFRVVTLVNLTKLYPQGFKDFFQESYQDLYSLSSRRTTDPNVHPQAKWLRIGQKHGKDSVLPEYVHHILVAVMYYLADHASVSVECSMEILNRQVGLGFGERPGEENVLSIPYDLSGYAQSWKKLGPVLMNKPQNGGRFACKFNPGQPRPRSVGPAYVWIHMARSLNIEVLPPTHLSLAKQGLMVLHSQEPADSIRQGKGLMAPAEVATFGVTKAVNFHQLSNYPAMWGDKCTSKQRLGKCKKRMVDIETKIRYAKAFYDPYQNRSVLPDPTQSVVFLPPQVENTRKKRQVFAAIAVVTAFAVQGVADYTGYKGIQGLEQELNDDMNTRAVANNVRFRQADNAIGNLSRQIQDLNAKVEQLSEEDEATVELLLRTIKTQALENKILQGQIGENNRALVEMSKVYLQTATANRDQSDAQTYLFKTIVSALGNSKPFLKQGIGYTWRLNEGLMRLQAIEKQLVDVRGADRRIDYDIIIDRTCHQWQNTERRTEVQEAEETLKLDVERHLDEMRNLSIKINITRPKPIEIHFVPELTNLSLHESGKRMKKAFEKVMKHPVDAIEETGNVVIGFFKDLLKSPLKIILAIGAVIILVIILAAILKHGHKRYQDKQQSQVVDMGMIRKLTKPYRLK